MWAARLRPEPVAGCLACFSWLSWKLDPGRSGGSPPCLNVVISRHTLPHGLHILSQTISRMCEYNVVTVRRCLLGPTGNQSFPCLPKLPCQDIMLLLPNEGDGVEEREGRREGRKYVCVFVEDNYRSCPLLLPEEGTALMVWGGEYCCKSAHLLPFTLVLQPPL